MTAQEIHIEKEESQVRKINEARFTWRESIINSKNLSGFIGAFTPILFHLDTCNNPTKQARCLHSHFGMGKYRVRKVKWISQDHSASEGLKIWTQSSEPRIFPGVTLLSRGHKFHGISSKPSCPMWGQKAPSSHWSCRTHRKQAPPPKKTDASSRCTTLDWALTYLNVTFENTIIPERCCDLGF